MRFTDRSIKALKPDSKRRDVTETEVSPDRRGLQLRIYPSGTKTFQYRYQFRGRTHRLKLGNYPTMSVAKAHEAQHAARSLLTQGIDPSVKDAVRPETCTVADLADEWIERYLKKNRKSWKEVERTLKKDVLPILGHRPAHSITMRDSVQLLDRIADRGALTMANRVRALCLQMYKFGIQRALVNHNPFDGTAKPGGQEKTRDRVLSDTELRKFWQGLDLAPMAQDLKIAVKMLLVTGQRRTEVARAEWSEFDLKKEIWSIPATRTKNGLPHTVPLSGMALTLLHELRNLSLDDRWLFPIRRRRADKSVHPRSLTRAVADNISVFTTDHFRLHDLRRTVRSRLSALGIDAVVAKKIVNHKLMGMDATYDRHSYDQEKRQALEAWSAELRHIISADNDKPALVAIG